MDLTAPDGRVWKAREARDPRRTYGRRFYTVFDVALAQIGRHPALRGQGVALTLLTQLPQTLEWGRWLPLDQKATADLLGTSQQVVSRALARLVAAGAVERKGGRGPGVLWRLSSSWGWRGTPGAFQEHEASKCGEAHEITGAEGWDLPAPPPGPMAALDARLAATHGHPPFVTGPILHYATGAGPVTEDRAAAELGRLLAIMARLRAPDGCPWDRVQDFASIAPYTVEEGYEVADAIGRGDPVALQDELGDLLLQVVYHAQMAREDGRFGFADVAKSINDKMIRRHPHVFGEDAARDVATQNAAWEVQKAAERAARAENGTLAGVAVNLPALTRAVKLTRRAALVGFDWPDAAQVLEKLAEEAEELRAELPAADPARLADELGDLLFVVANLARKLDLDPEACLRGANAKFERRFGAVERGLAEEGRAPADASLEEMEALWQRAKRAERG